MRDAMMNGGKDPISGTSSCITKISVGQGQPSEPSGVGRGSQAPSDHHLACNIAYHQHP